MKVILIDMADSQKKERFGTAPARPRREDGPRDDSAAGAAGESDGLDIRRMEDAGTITLRLSGALAVSSLLRLRDAAFTAIGDRPRLLCLDLTRLAQIEIAAIQTMVTIGRVARLVNVGFRVRPSGPLRDVITSTGLVRMLPLADEDSAAAGASF